MVTTKTQLAINTAIKVARAPEVALQFSKALFRRRVALPLDYHFRDGRSGPFDLVHIKLVNACNLRCKMCGQWGESGYHFKQAPSYLRDLVPIESLLRVIDDVTEWKPWISISGGEAFLHPKIFTLIEHIKRKRLVLTVSTNGLTLAEDAARLVDLGVNVLYVSLDGSGENHDRIRGLKGAFQKTVGGIEAVQKYKREHSRAMPFIIISAAVSLENANNFDEIFEVAERVQADGLVASYGWFQTEESCRQHDTIMQEELGTFPMSHRGWIWSYGSIDVEALVDTVKRIESRTWSFPHTFMPKLSYDEIPRYYEQHENTFGSDRCKCPWCLVQILPNGDVSTCIDLPDYVAGNIKEASIIDIWNNERYRRFRGVVKEHGHLPACTRCSGLAGRGL